MGRWTAVGAAVLLLAGCGASKQVVRAPEAALTALRAELARRTEERDAWQARATRAEAGADECAEALEAARADLTAARREVETCRAGCRELAAREAELRERLRAEIEAKTVAVERSQRALAVRLDETILFDPGDADIRPAGIEVLDKIASVVAGTGERIRVEGHTDDRPVGRLLKYKFFSNWELSAARACSVVRYLQYGRDIAPERLEAVGLASHRPVAGNRTAEGRRRNRRVEVVLTPAEPKP
ncbi:MAG: hypothetical protein Kow0092_07880 [Deferrisomatales bacterium]